MAGSDLTDTTATDGVVDADDPGVDTSQLPEAAVVVTMKVDTVVVAVVVAVVIRVEVVIKAGVVGAGAVVDGNSG